MSNKKSLIIYFSRADENYNVGYIDKGNTEVVAEYVKEITGADMFKVEPLIPYAKDYQTCIKEAKERIGNAPIKEIINDISEDEVRKAMGLPLNEIIQIYYGYLEKAKAEQFMIEAMNKNIEKLLKDGGNIYPNTSDILNKLSK